MKGVITKELADNFRKQAKVFQAIIDAADVIDQLSSLDNAVLESKKRLEVSKAEEASVLAGIEGLKAEIKALTGKKSDASVRAEKMLADAEAQAKELVVLANADKDGILKNAHTMAMGIVAEAEQKAAKINGDIEIAKTQLDAINAEIAEKSKERTSLQKAIDGIKAKFA